MLRALARGGSSTKVAAELQRSVNTVNVHVKSIMRKLGCTTRHEAIAIAREHGLILPDAPGPPCPRGLTTALTMPLTTAVTATTIHFGSETVELPNG